MPALPDDIATTLAMFAPLFTQSTFEHARLLLIGAILAPGRRTVAAVLRTLGLADEPQLQQYHRVLNRAVWSSRQAAGTLTKALVAVFGGGGPLVFGIDETLERRRGAKLAPQALLCTDLSATPLQIISWFIRRWRMETTFQAVRTHLGVETQRQWNDLAIARTTPALLGLFSLITLLAHPHFLHREPPVRRAAWYPKAQPTFADALACVRRQIWRAQDSAMSLSHSDRAKLTPALHDRLVEALCYAA